MRAFLIGLLFLLVALTLAGIFILIAPLIVILNFIVRTLIAIAIVLFSIWLLGKFILFVWDKLNEVDE